MRFFKENWFKLIIAVFLLVVGFIAYDVFVTQPREAVDRENARIVQEKLEEEVVKLERENEKKEIESKYTRCVSDAYDNYALNWASSCKSRGALSSRCSILRIDYSGDSLGAFVKYKEWHPEATFTEYSNAAADCACSLPSIQAESWNDLHTSEKATCLERFPT